MNMCSIMLSHVPIFTHNINIDNTCDLDLQVLSICFFFLFRFERLNFSHYDKIMMDMHNIMILFL